MGRVVDLEEAARAVAAARRGGARVVLANGHFDLLHVGHVRYLSGAREEGDLLVVGVNGDDATARLKGPGRPVLPAADRAEVVAALEGVELVVIFDETDVSRLLRTLRPDVHCKGTDYTEGSVPERQLTSELGGATRIVGDPKEHGTRDLIARILERFGKNEGESA